MGAVASRVPAQTGRLKHSLLTNLCTHLWYNTPQAAFKQGLEGKCLEKWDSWAVAPRLYTGRALSLRMCIYCTLWFFEYCFCKQEGRPKPGNLYTCGRAPEAGRTRSSLYHIASNLIVCPTGCPRLAALL